MLISDLFIPQLLSLIHIFTGCCTVKNGVAKSFSNVTLVEFFELSDLEIEEYIATGEPFDKAGAYKYEKVYLNPTWSGFNGSPHCRLSKESHYRDART